MAVSIAELRKKRAGFIAEMKAIATKDDSEDGDASRFDDLEKCVKDHDDRIEKLESVMQLEADNAEPADNEEMSFTGEVTKVAKINRFNIGTSFKRPVNEAKGTRFARFVIGAGLMKSMGKQGGMDYIDDAFGDAEVVKALNTTTQSTGGALIPQDFRQELIDLLYAETVIRGSGAQVIPMPMGNLTWPRLNAGATAAWQTELDDIAISNQGFDDIQFTAHKLTALVPVSNDLVRRSPLSVEAIVRANMSKMMARAEDIAFLTSNGSGNEPTGITSLLSSGNIFTETSGSPTLSIVNNILMNMELALKGNNVPVGSAKWIMHPVVRSYLSTLTDSVGRYFFREELDRGQLIGYPVLETTQLPTNLGGSTNETQIIFAAMDQLAIADTLAMFADSSSEATYVNSGTTVSAYQRDQTLFRCISEVDFNILHPAAAAVTTVKLWSPSGYTPVAGAAYVTQTANTSPSSAGSANPV